MSRKSGWNHSEETKCEISKANKGKERPDELRRRISLALKGRKKPPRTAEHCRKLSEANKGKTISDEHKRRLSVAHKGSKRPPRTEEWRRKMSKAHKGKIISKEHKQRLSEAHKGKTISEEHKQAVSDANKGKIVSDESRRRMSESHTDESKRNLSIVMKRRWDDPLFAERMIQASRKAVNQKPNSTEQRLTELLNTWFPGEWRYVGNGDLIMGRRIPDFMNVNGKKLLIELFGTYWHSEEKTGIEEVEHEQERVNHFATYGYKTLVVWERELEDLVSLRQKVVDFEGV